MTEHACKVVVGVVIGVVVLIAALLAVSLKKLNSDEIGLKYDVINKKLSDTPSFEGLTNGPPGFHFIIFPSVYRSLDFYNIQCLNKDGVEIRLNTGFQYRVRYIKLHKIVTQFTSHDKFKLVLTDIAESAIHDACSKFNTSQFQAERGAFQEEVRKKLMYKLDGLDTDITDVQVSNIERPSQYESAVRKKESAREDISVANNERPQKLTSAETKRLEAQTQARIALDKAESDARIKETKAQAEGQAILDRYTKEADSYKYLISSSGLGLSINDFLSYLAVRALEDAANPMQINLDSPARTNWQS